jgi:hypothetical protein
MLFGFGGTSAETQDSATPSRHALEQAGVRYVEIRAGTTSDEMQRIIRQLLTVAAPPA